MTASDTYGAPTSETAIYEYKSQELYAKRDENQIYGLLYIPESAGEKMPADISKFDYLNIPAKDIWGVVMRKDNPLAVKKTICKEDLIGMLREGYTGYF